MAGNADPPGVPRAVTPAEVRHETVSVNGVALHVVAYPPDPVADPEPFLLLHGFPEFWYSWRYVMPLLARGGEVAGDHPCTRQVYALDLRGYNRSAKPRGVRHYRLPLLWRDVVGIIAHVTRQQHRQLPGAVHLVGHDWGGALAWDVARYYPARVRHLSVLNCPPVEVLLRGIWRVPRQLLQSYYIFLIQVPGLPERFLRHRHARAIRQFYRRVRGPGGRPLTSREVAKYVQAFDRPRGASGVNYYRAAVRGFLTGRLARSPPVVQCPTSVAWGVRDAALNVQLTREFPRLVAPGNLSVTYVPEGTHHVQQDHPGVCARVILEGEAFGSVVPGAVDALGAPGVSGASGAPDTPAREI